VVGRGEQVRHRQRAGVAHHHPDGIRHPDGMAGGQRDDEPGNLVA